MHLLLHLRGLQWVKKLGQVVSLAVNLEQSQEGL